MGEILNLVLMKNWRQHSKTEIKVNWFKIRSSKSNKRTA